MQHEAVVGAPTGIVLDNRRVVFRWKDFAEFGFDKDENEVKNAAKIERNIIKPKNMRSKDDGSDDVAV